MNVLEDQVRAAVQQTRQAMEAAFNDLRLARERLRLVKEEYEAAVATDQAARANLQTLREKSAGSETATALAALQREVDQLEKDVAFQHNGLVQNQTKLAAERKAVELHQTNHAARVADLEAFLHQSRHRQNKLLSITTQKPESSSSKPGAAQMLQLHLDQQHHHQPDPSRWPAIFRKKSQGLQKAMAEEKATIAALERILAGYETYLPQSSSPPTPEQEKQP